MKLGLYAPLPHISINTNEISESINLAHIGLEDGKDDPGFRLAKDIVVRADELGFELALFAERLLGPDLESWILASAVGSATNNIKIMTAVHPGLWDPAMVAKLTSSLDRVCKGRVAVNLITGWWEEEHTLFGGHPLQGDERYLLAEEFAKVLKGYLSGQPFEFKGTYFQTPLVTFPSKPASGAIPELFAASRSDRGLNMIAEVADYWFVDYKPSDDFEQVLLDVQTSIESMKQRCEKTGRKVKFAMNGFAVVSETDEQAHQKLEYFLQQDENIDPRFAHIRKGFVKAGFVGSYDVVADRIQRLEALGVELCLFQYFPTIEEIELIGLHLLPKIK